METLRIRQPLARTLLQPLRRLVRRLRAARGPSVVTRDGILMYLHSPTVDFTIGPAILRDRVWEPCESRLFTEAVRPGMVVADVGANIGYYTLLAAKAAGPDGRVYAFEPEPRNLYLLRRNVRANGFQDRVIVVPAAVADAPGRGSLFLAPRNMGDHRVFGAAILEDDDERERVAVARTDLDGFFAREGVRPDVIKMDIQGSELLALRGMTRLLGGGPGPTIFTEVWRHGLAEAGGSARELIRTLATAGFDFARIDEEASTATATSATELVELAEQLAATEVLILMCRRG